MIDLDVTLGSLASLVFPLVAPLIALLVAHLICEEAADSVSVRLNHPTTDCFRGWDYGRGGVEVRVRVRFVGGVRVMVIVRVRVVGGVG